MFTENYKASFGEAAIGQPGLVSRIREGLAVDSLAPQEKMIALFWP